MHNSEANKTTSNYEAADQVCIICKSTEGDPLKMFVEKTWGTFKKAAQCRLLLQSDCYRDITTEVNLKEEMGNGKYHSKCYRNFTAVKRPSTDSQSRHPSKKPETRCRSSMPPSDAKGLLRGSCIFCTVQRKTIKRKVEPLSDCLTKDGCDAIITAAPRSSNERVKALVANGIDLLAKEAQYHKSCRRDFFKEIEVAPKTADMSSRRLHATTFEAISGLIEIDIIGNGKAMLSTSILELHRTEFLSLGGLIEDVESYTVQALMNKIKLKFGQEISISTFDHRKGNFVYSSDMSENDARASLLNDDEKHLHVIRTAALYLRVVIQAMPKWKTPTPTSVTALKASSPELPEELLLFYKTLLCGLREPSGNDSKDAVDRKVTAMSSDAVYNTSRGAVRPWKHTVLGLGIGTLTGSKLILRILNRLGNSLSYDEVKALETEFAYSIEERDRDTPDGVELNPNLGTGLAWDNYDVNMETMDGKDTLHATVGICYQNKTDILSTNKVVNDEGIVSGTHGGRNRRQFEGKEREIAPYYKELKKACFDLSALKENHEPEKVPTLHVIDFYWLLQSAVGKPLPLFPGFFSKFTTDHLPQQRIWYMDPISAPPTRNDVVRETMRRAMNVAIETQQEYGIVTYDLAVALKAYSIQALDAPLFDKLLIMLGNFHLELAFYGAIGTYINESGVEHLLTESGVLAEGSLMGFIRGKYYNRCVRIHDILALAMERKVYNSFKSTLTQEVQDAIEGLLAVVPQDLNAQEQFLNTHPIFQDHMDQYELFLKDVMNGKLGPTAQYWSLYVFMINRVHRDLMRALRTNDVSGYIAILPAVIDIFFGLNRPNYARWGVLFLNQLMKAAPPSIMALQSGGFSIRRTRKNFARSAIDLTLEQTVNRDAASPMRGIVGFHYSHNAIRRWCITSTQRGMSVTELRSLTGMETQEQPATQLRASRIEKDSRQKDVLINEITQSCDPFSSPATMSSGLLNIATGKAASQETKKYLTESLVAGHELRVKFQEECAADVQRFLKPIQRRRVSNFAQENVKKRSTTAKAKSAAESLRDVFIRLLVIISDKTPFNLRHVMTFPVTEFPLSITHSDGSGLKTDKSKLLRKLEELQGSFTETPLPPIDVTLIDGGFLIHSFLSAIGNITSYRHLARKLLAYVCANQGNEIHVLFDTYRPMSLKESERKLRGAEDCPFVITGPEQAPRQNCQKLLQNGIFKDQLAIFLLKEWQENQYGSILGKKTLIVSHGGNCARLSFSELEVKMKVENPAHLQSSHEEADTLLAFHAASALGNVVVRASDTDVMVILLGMLGRHMEESHTETAYRRIIMDCGSGNNRRHIDVSKIATALESTQKGLAAAIPGLHAFTGCDFTASFYRKGKVKPLEVLQKDTTGTLIQFFSKLSFRDEPDQSKAEEFICSLYGMKEDVKTVNEARYVKLHEMTGKLKQENVITSVRKVDCALLPPCANTVHNKLRRAHFISILWGSADSPHPGHGLDPLNFGWKEKNGFYVPEWFVGPALPDNLFQEEEQEDGSVEDLQCNIPDAATVFEDAKDSSFEPPWSDDSTVKQRSEQQAKLKLFSQGLNFQIISFTDTVTCPC
ncbi:hypothetical protein HOLleu_25241 [Holothuria leucospilota]|uniref:Uncharacterized protein n=1 Tax=Holothuria leucospilota TaxID=206669 RepID=A0A9Q1H3C1_HOLLE|nr:hypothetical protein HOLleu_25241 [Holothuria leucospilota]